jgi:mannose-6-phosphate isomerase-like protein (cupin superfamily)
MMTANCPARYKAAGKEPRDMSVHLVTPETAEVINLEPFEPLTIRILEDGSHTGHRAGVIRGSLPPGGGGPPQHIHREHDEMFFVVSGTVRFSSGDERIDVSAGGLVTAPIDTPHTFANPDPSQPSTMLCTVTPDRYVNYFRELGALARSSEEVSPSAILEVMSHYATELYQP